MIKLEVSKTDRTDLYRKPPNESDSSNLISESFELWNEGVCKAIYIHNFPMESLRESILKVNKFATSRRQSGVASRSLIFGFSPRMPVQQRDYCNQARLNTNFPETKEVLFEYAKQFSSLYGKIFPERHQHSLDAVQNVLPDWRIPDSVYTSGIINLDNPLQYHYDAGNFEGTWSTMAVFKKNTMGGHLVLPDYNVKVACGDSSLFIFDGQSELHGVTPIIKQPDGYRYSVVFYALEAMCKCGNPKDELKRAQISRTNVEMKRAGLMK